MRDDSKGGHGADKAPPRGRKAGTNRKRSAVTRVHDRLEARGGAGPAKAQKGGATERHPRRDSLIPHEPTPGATPGTLMVAEGPKPRIFLIDYAENVVTERELSSVDEIIVYLQDDLPSITWIDVRGIHDRQTFERLGQILHIHPLALEDVVNVPQRPHTDTYPSQQLIIARMVQLDAHGCVATEQLGIVFSKTFVLTVQEEHEHDCLEPVRARIRGGRGSIRTAGADYLAYALIDAVVDGFYPVLETVGERLEDLELKATLAPRGMSRDIHDIKRELLTIRRAIWPQRDLVNSLLRDGSPHIADNTRIYLRDTYDHAVQVMDMVETFREIASGLMDLYLAGVSNKMNEVMKVLTIISTIFLPITFIAGVYGMNFDPDSSPWSMPELRWKWGYPVSLTIMGMSVIGLLYYYKRKGWLGRDRTM